MIGKVGGGPEAVPVHSAAPVLQPQRADFQAIQIERRAVQGVSFQPGNRGLRHVVVKYVLKRTADRGQSPFRSEDGYRVLLPEVERAHVVEPHDVVGVLVREQDGVKAVDFGPQRLGAEVGRGVDEDVASAVADKDGRPQAIVARIA